ncbi:MAG: hypothetical protein HGA40_01055 [Methanoregulaceae archaeon]|nr:hypothetical protein [Methanoregulaceae archaeon]
MDESVGESYLRSGGFFKRFTEEAQFLDEVTIPALDDKPGTPYFDNGIGIGEVVMLGQGWASFCERCRWESRILVQTLLVLTAITAGSRVYYRPDTLHTRHLKENLKEILIIIYILLY